MRLVAHMDESHHTCEWVMSHIWMSHVTRMKEMCQKEWVMSHIGMSHVTHMNELCRTYEWVMSHIWTSHVTHKNEPYFTHERESCHTYESVTSHIRIRYFTKKNQSCYVEKWSISHTKIRHVTHINASCHRRWENGLCEFEWVIWLIEMTHSYLIRGLRAFEWVMSQMAHWDYSFISHTYDRVTSQVVLRHVTQRKWVMSHRGMRHVM